VRIVAWVDGYPPQYCIGASMMLHEILIGMRQRGHEVRVFDLRRYSGTFEGIEIVPLNAGRETEAYEWADVVITQTNGSHNAAMHFASRCPIVYINHDPKDLLKELPRNQKGLLVVFNSLWASRQFNLSFDQIVMPPPVHPEKYRTEKGNRITLVNMNQNKGGDIFWQLVLALPNHEFLGVEGAYGHQIKSKTTPVNVKIEPMTSDMKSVYSQSRIVIMPSKVETYGRVGVEAFASGIPVIASPTDGLKEALGDAGIFVASRNVSDWVEEIQRLDDLDAYQTASKLAYQRSEQLNPRGVLDAFEDALVSLKTKSGQK
jgi:glycosyltransferase involved in cell wall biosynthesis